MLQQLRPAPPRPPGARLGVGGGVLHQALLTLALVLVELIQISHCSSGPGPDDALQFTSDSYNATILENSVGRVFVVPSEKMGIYNADPGVSIKYNIKGGDTDNFFKAQAEKVGDFVFLTIRTKTSSNNVLNRERTPSYLLDVRATFRDSDKRRLRDIHASTKVLVAVLDTNDLDPFFNPSSYAVTVPEDAPLHSSLLRVHAEDADEGINGEVYYNFAKDTDQFSINPVSGVISLTRPLSYSDTREYSLQVEARDRGSTSSLGPRRVDTANVRLTVAQVNLHDPLMTVQHLPEVIEQSHADIYAIVHISDADLGRHGEVSSVEIIEGDPDAHFRVRPGSEPGEFNVEVLKLLDREVAPHGYNLTLKATDNGLPPRSSYKQLHVRLGDMNDHQPVFEKEEYRIRVPESALVNTPITRLKARDLDTGRNAEVRLSIVAGNGDGKFRIDPITGMLYVAAPLDAEKKTRYTLTVAALDQANAGVRKQSSARVRILVTDVNDNQPKFPRDQKTIYFDENEPGRTRVTRVNAKDADSGENQQISYSIANPDADEIPFVIDHSNGVIKSTRLVDYESDRREYKLQVRASDWGQPFRRQSELRLTVRIKDINDNRPQFERLGCVGKVSRSLPLGGEILTLSALDFDAGNMISYRIVTGNTDACFYLDETSGVLSTKCDLARLPMFKRILNVTATDGQHFADVMPIEINLVETEGFGGDTSLNGEMSSFKCKETGVAQRLAKILQQAEKNNRGKEEFPPTSSRYLANIHFPVFERIPQSFYVNETAPIGADVFQVTAEDQDLGFNGQLVYVISSGDKDAVFGINITSGMVSVIAPLDREKTAEYFLNITACDQGKPQKCTSILCQVIVLDENDNPPVFMKSAFSFFFPENTRNGTPVVTLNATDVDSGMFGQVSYRLETETEDFTLDPETGVLVVSRELDRESTEFYDLTIRAVDGDPNKPLSAFANVRVRILDVNDVAPIFTSRHYFVKAREDLPVGSVVGFVDASDPDLYQGGQIQFSIDHGAEDKFYIDKLSGAVKVKNKLDYETKQQYNLTVLAIDGGSPSLVSVAAFVVEILDVNENLHPPRFDSFFIEAKVPENMPIGSHVTQIRAIDYDEEGSDDSRISYSIRAGDGLNSFSIDDNGQIRTLAVLDREAKESYWLTVYAMDHGAVPLYSELQVFIEVLNLNDNIPLTVFPVYFPTVMENAKPNTPIVTIEAFDADNDPNQQMVFAIVSGDPQSLFSINPTTGQISTTARKLDREAQSEHILEVRVSDSSSPPLNSTTRVVITVLDQNDNSPVFLERYYKIKIPETLIEEDESLQKDQENSDKLESSAEEDARYDALFENSTWEVFEATDMGGEDILRVIATDKDSDVNSRLVYSINSGQSRAGKFQIHPETGVVHTTASLLAGEQYELQVAAKDSGNPELSGRARLSLEVVSVPLLNESLSAPTVAPSMPVEVFESDPVGHLVTLISAEDADGDDLFYRIVGGNAHADFSISRDKGSVIVARPLDWERQAHYMLNISVTDGVRTAFTALQVSVIDVNEDRPEFSATEFQVEVGENISLGSKIIQLNVTDSDKEKNAVFSLHTAQSPSSLQTFRIDPSDGSVYLRQKLDREHLAQHILTVAVKDHGPPSMKNFARLVVSVTDHNDHTPKFLSDLIQTRLHETAEVGSSVVQALAVDTDHGENGRISYSILSGNVGNAFMIDQELGILRVARTLDITVQPEYMIILKARDHGQPPLSASVPVHIQLTLSDTAPPRFVHSAYATEVYEDLPIGHFVMQVEARSQSSLHYEIVTGNEEGRFQINPSTGIIMTQRQLDFEQTRFYNMTVQVSNMLGKKAQVGVDIHILDINDNPPQFERLTFEGNISESAPIGSLILVNNTNPLVIKAHDADSGLSALLLYEILEEHAKRFFSIDSSTGAIRTIKSLDYESQSFFEFNVRVSDMGKPRLSADTTANVRIYVRDENDSPPLFSKSEYTTTLLLPTFKNVSVIVINATDPDTKAAGKLEFSITAGNEAGLFGIDSGSGRVFVQKPGQIGSLPKRTLDLGVSDGKFTAQAKLNIFVKKSDNSGLAFSRTRYYATVLENSTKSDVVLVVNVLGSALNENLKFRLLNPTDLFTIGSTSGALRTTGKVFDREEREKYELIVEVRSQERSRLVPRIAHVIVDVTVLDLNDNPPVFVNKPYLAVVSKEAKANSPVITVTALDRDKGSNGDIYYQLVRGNGELFTVGRKSGRISLRRRLDSGRKEYTLTIAAYDGGSPPYSAETPVRVKVVDKSVPTFNQQSFEASVPEDVEPFSPVISATATAPDSGGQLIYTIENGNEEELFSIDYNAGVVYVTQSLDYETKQHHQLTLRATESVAGGYTEAILFVNVEDVNDSPPQFTSDNYNIELSEAMPQGSVILKVEAKDQDTGHNQELEYSLHSDQNETSGMFSIVPNTGEVILNRPLDRERQEMHRFTVTATDKGPKPLTGEAQVWLTVLDSNDNSPEFEEAEYSFVLSDKARRGQFVGKVRAVDPDLVDQTNIRYAVIGGNEHQIFSIDEATGVISLVNLHNFDSVDSYLLNVSVTDGVYSSFAKVKITLQSANKSNPKFAKSVFEVSVKENLDVTPRAARIGQVTALDGDGDEMRYKILSNELEKEFRIDPSSGSVYSLNSLDRELRPVYEIPIAVTDQGGRNGFTTLKINVADENDNSPSFPLADYKANIQANMTVGSTVLRVTATDPDEDKNAALTYTIYETTKSGVDDIFTISPDAGQIILKRSAADLENQVYQFFVRAADQGKPSRHTDVPVEVYVMSPQEQPPKFEERDSVYFIAESSPVGQTVAQLSAVAAPESRITYSIASTEYQGEDSLFQIDQSGRLDISGLLDREKRSVHKVTILAETDSSPSLVAYTDLTVNVLDANDNPPVFQANPYHVTVSEALSPHTQLLQVSALDKDFANNGEVRYSFSEDTLHLAHLFSIDPHQGWITTQGVLDFEEERSYKLTVVAEDNGRAKLSATADVEIELVDYNDNPPVFSQRVYSAAVNEDALPGTIIFQLETTDADSTVTPVEFSIISGDELGQFQIKENGEMYVARALDREEISQYRMEVVATDGVFMAKCRVTIEILDDNDSPPRCSKSLYRETVPESVSVGSALLTVTATDDDEGPNARQTFKLSGPDSSLFNIGDNSGVLRTALPLDREEQSHLVVKVHVQDAVKPEWECVSIVEILVTDANDNSPVWEPEQFLASLKEDAAIGTIVTKVHATDSDLGENRKLSYSFVESSEKHFLMDSKTGIVSLAKKLDRETKESYNLTVRVIDSGQPRLSTDTSLVIRVLDVNDNPPEFASKYYFASIREGEPVGTDVVQLMASSRDAGVNAEITYSIIGGNEGRKFMIKADTGLVSVAGEIDHERAKEYFLTVQAKDGGSPPLSNHATVNITVMDANDNPPVFTQSSYTATINEKSLVGKEVVVVTATDLDKGSNGIVSYRLVHGDSQGQFEVDPRTGRITLVKRLDREMISSYVLEVQAIDQGSPVLSTSVLINVNIEDSNDNAPVFAEGNYTVYVQEDRPYGHVLLRFTVTDSDDSPNGAPFTWDIRSGNEEGAFRVVQDGSLRTAKQFDHNIKDKYLLKIRVFDNGTPPLYSDTFVTVHIIEESQYPPVISPLEVEVFSYQDDFPGSIVGRIVASDQDPHDVLGYELLPSYTQGGPASASLSLFEMDQRDGTLVALQGLDVGSYNLNVSVTDGKFTTTQAARVTVKLVTDNLLEKAVILRIERVSPEQFVVNYRKTFTKIMKNLFNVRSKDVEILGIQPTFGSREKREQGLSQPNVELLLAIVREGSTYFSRSEVRRTLEEKLTSIGAQLGLRLLGVEVDQCTNSSCENGKCKDKVMMSEAQIVSVTTDVASLVFPQFHWDKVCQCKNGFAGKMCEMILNECHREPCPSFKTCVPDSSPAGYSCQCPPGLGGTHCSINLSNCKERKCSVVNPLTFAGRSYAQYTLKRSVERHLSLSLGFRTRYKVATIMHAEGQVDYSIMEIVDGHLQYRFNFGSGEGLVRLADKVVSDGEWHEVKLERHGNSAEISVDSKWRTHGAAPGHNDVLNLEQTDVFFGATVVDGAAVKEPTISRGFVGCMDDIQIDHVPLPLHIKGDSQVAKLKRFTNISFKCEEPIEPGACGSAPCQHGGICSELPTPLGYACTCPGRFSGASCEYDLDPCASSPCLHGAKCVNLKNDFHCECPAQLSGKRCHYGRYCNPNPCQNGGVCEEGAFGPICKCRGFTGEFCTIDVNECLHQNPCHNGGTCINSPGGFTCICQGNSTGLYCSDAGLVSLARRRYALTLEEVVGIILSLFIIVIIVALFVLCRKFRVKNRNGNRNLLIQNEFDKEHIMMKPRQNGNGHKLNNLQVEQDLPLLPQGGRPPSISPSLSNHETQFNYMDTVRSYGSAADELETLHRPAIRHRELPQDYIQNIQKPVATVAPSMIRDRDMNLKDNYFMRRKSPPMDVTRPSSNASSGVLYRPSKLQVALPTEGEETCQSELSVEEDCQRYHWDCSDWASQGLQPMMELPNGEIIANTSWVTGGASNSAPPVQPQEPVDPSRDIETLPEGEDEEDGGGSVQDSEGESQLGAVYPDSDPRSPMHQTNKSIEELMMVNDMNYADDDNDSVEIPNVYDYQLHLNNYLPTYHLGSDPDTDEATPMLGRHPMPFPSGLTSPDNPTPRYDDSLPPPRYATIGVHQPPLSQDPEALARKGGAVRGRVKPVLTANGMGTLGPLGPMGRSEDKLCDLEDEEEEEGEDNAGMSRSTRV